MIKTTIRDLVIVGIKRFSDGKTWEIINFDENSDERLLLQECKLISINSINDNAIAIVEECHLNIGDYKLSLLEKELDDSIQSYEVTTVAFLKKMREKLYSLKSKEYLSILGTSKYYFLLQLISEIIEAL